MADLDHADSSPRRGSGIDRRTLIKGAAAAGAVAWTAPVIIGSIASPAAAQTPLAGCSRYAFGWDCLGCTQRLDSSANYIYNAGVTATGPSCCPAGTPNWNSAPNSTCVTMTTGLLPSGPNTCQSSATPPTDFFVRFTIDANCPDCFITDPGVTFVDPGPSTCENTAASNDDVGGSDLYTSWQWNFTGTKYPRWFRLWVRCGSAGSGCTIQGAGSKTI
jgi:hypothetical protein